MNRTDQAAEVLQKPPFENGGFFFAQMQPANLFLENGMVFKGKSPEWQQGAFDGEIVFTTGMTGYDAALTDPSYAGQILTFTYPLMGNYGIPPSDMWESERIFASGVIVSNACIHWSHGKSTQSLLQWLEAQRVPVIMGVDTRHLTKILRERGTMLGAISSADTPPDNYRDPNNASLADLVSISQKAIYGSGAKKVIAVDCGMKTNILRHLQKFPLTIHRVPYHYDYSEEDFDGIFLSNGPGNPEMYMKTVSVLRKAMQKKKPIFGICLGAQLLALSAGAKTYKLAYGHRSHNQPCMDLTNKRCYITSQNHGYAVEEKSLPTDWKVSFRNLNDGTIEGIAHVSLPFSAVQFHPEAMPGPKDTEWLFENFFASL